MLQLLPSFALQLQRLRFATFSEAQGEGGYVAAVRSALVRSARREGARPYAVFGPGWGC